MTEHELSAIKLRSILTMLSCIILWNYTVCLSIMIGILEEFLRTILTVQFSANANIKTESNLKTKITQLSHTHHYDILEERFKSKNNYVT